MNKMHTLAKTLITIAGIYWLVLIGVNAILTPIMMMVSCGSGLRGSWASWAGIFACMIAQLVILLVVMQILYRRNKIADKIVGVEETAPPQSQVEWIGFSFRLISVIAGLYCFYRAAGSIGMLINDIIRRKITYGGVAVNEPIYSKYLIIVILLTAGIYLFCGAPHFVRWQTRKTIEMCSSRGK
jgi:hypothetical protein